MYTHSDVIPRYQTEYDVQFLFFFSPSSSHANSRQIVPLCLPQHSQWLEAPEASPISCEVLDLTSLPFTIQLNPWVIWEYPVQLNPANKLRIIPQCVCIIYFSVYLGKPQEVFMFSSYGWYCFGCGYSLPGGEGGLPVPQNIKKMSLSEVS